jgi:hypothetical protein
MSKRNVTFYAVLERKKSWGDRAIIKAIRASKPGLRPGQCAVKLTIEVPEAAFERPVMDAGRVVVEHVDLPLAATATGEATS